MQIIHGTCNTAKVYATIVESAALDQVKALASVEAYRDCKIAMMPDMHAGAGATIGTTMTIIDKVTPSAVGVDIGCGMLVYNLGKVDINDEVLAKLDKVCHDYVKSGMNVWDKPNMDKDFANMVKVNLDAIRCPNINKDRALRSIGSLGGGNHFIELDKDNDGNVYLVIHCGSRHLGIEVANYYQDKAIKGYGSADRDALIAKLKAEGRKAEIADELAKIKVPSVPNDLKWVEGKDFDDYINDMRATQAYASFNRGRIGDIILDSMGWDMVDYEVFETIHNYIDIDNMILRKGSVSAQLDEMLIIPMNMRDGSLICRGKGNSDWNYSAPHGAGRLMSRSKAKENLSLDKFEESMSGIYTTCVGRDTLDESPMAYKPMKQILEDIKDTVDVVNIIKPIYNFKASE